MDICSLQFFELNVAITFLYILVVVMHNAEH